MPTATRSQAAIEKVKLEKAKFGQENEIKEYEAWPAAVTNYPPVQTPDDKTAIPV